LELDDILIQALSQPRNYSEWYITSLNLRRENNETLSRSTFNKSYQRLLEDKIIVSKDINGREKEFQIRVDEKERYLSRKEDEKIIQKLLDDSKKVLKGFSNNFSNVKPTWLDDPLASEVSIYKINHLLLIQKRMSLVSNRGKIPKIHDTVIRRSIEKCDLAIKNYFKAYDKLDKDLCNRIFASLLHESKREIFDDKLYPTIWKAVEKRQNKKSKN